MLVYLIHHMQNENSNSKTSDMLDVLDRLSEIRKIV